MTNALLRSAARLLSLSNTSLTILKDLGKTPVVADTLNGESFRSYSEAKEAQNLKNSKDNIKKNLPEEFKNSEQKAQRIKNFNNSLEKVSKDPKEKYFIISYPGVGANVYPESKFPEAFEKITGYSIKIFNDSSSANSFLDIMFPNRKFLPSQRCLDVEKEKLFKSQANLPVSNVYCIAANYRKSSYSFSGYGILFKDEKKKITSPIEDKEKKTVLKGEITSIFKASDIIYDKMTNFRYNKKSKVILFPKLKICCALSADKFKNYISKYLKDGPGSIHDLDAKDLQSLRKIVEIQKFYKENEFLFGGHEFEITSTDLTSTDTIHLKEAKKLAYNGVVKGADPRYVEILDLINLNN